MARRKVEIDTDKLNLIFENREYTIYKDPKDNSTIIYPKDSNLRYRLYMSSNDDLFSNNLSLYCPLDSLINKSANQLASDIEWAHAHEAEDYKEIVKIINEAWAAKYPDIVTENRKGRYRHSDFYTIIKKNDELLIRENGMVYAGKVQKVTYIQNFFETYIAIELIVIANISGEFIKYKKNKYIRNYEGYKNINELPIEFLDEKTKGELNERGLKIYDMAKNAAYKTYTGQQTRFGEWGRILNYRSDGRIMIDSKSFNQFDADQVKKIRDELFDGALNEDSDDEELDKVNNVTAPSDLWTIYPKLFGFSFITKLWGMFDLSGISDIEFRNDAYDRLVLDTDIKEIILALIEGIDIKTSDIVSAKGNGTIFLLHGNPGVGKTLTAEAVAETLKRPLYSISVGELGTNPDALEDSLRNILELSTAWNAVLLLDEADVFLEARSDNDVERNAMVGVFLRLLEYHQGVLFLTTNRAHNFDPAFFSRISVAINYPDMTSDTRKKIWDNLCKTNNIVLNTDELSKIEDINGREIRNILKVSRTLANHRKQELNTDHVLATINNHLKFKKSLSKR